MNRPVLAVTAALAASAVVAGCGSAGSTSSSARPPAAVLAAAADSVGSTSLRYDLDGTVTLDASGLTGDTSALGALGAGKVIHITATGQQESPQRSRTDITVDAGGTRQSVTAVLYDGQLFYSTDGGTTFGTGGTLKDLTGGVDLSPAHTTDLLKKVPNVTDAGPDGSGNEHYTAALDASAIQQILSQAASSASGSSTASGAARAGGLDPAAILGFVQQLIDFRGGSLDAFVRQSDGRLDHSSLVISMGLDLSKIATLIGGLGAGHRASSASGTAHASTSSSSSASAASTSTGAASSRSLPGGVLTVSIQLGTHTFGYGDSITITKPTVDPNAPHLPAGAGLFG